MTEPAKQRMNNVKTYGCKNRMFFSLICFLICRGSADASAFFKQTDVAERMNRAISVHSADLGCGRELLYGKFTVERVGNEGFIAIKPFKNCRADEIYGNKLIFFIFFS